MGSFLMITALVLICAVSSGIAYEAYLRKKEDAEEDLQEAEADDVFCDPGAPIIIENRDLLVVGTYAWAVRQLEEGKKVRRHVWVAMRESIGELYIEYVTRNLLEKKDVVKFCRVAGSDISVEFIPYMVFECDVRATDWELVA